MENDEWFRAVNMTSSPSLGKLCSLIKSAIANTTNYRHHEVKCDSQISSSDLTATEDMIFLHLLIKWHLQKNLFFLCSSKFYAHSSLFENLLAVFKKFLGHLK